MYTELSYHYVIRCICANLSLQQVLPQQVAITGSQLQLINLICQFYCTLIRIEVIYRINVIFSYDVILLQ